MEPVRYWAGVILQQPGDEGRVGAGGFDGIGGMVAQTIFASSNRKKTGIAKAPRIVENLLRTVGRVLNPGFDPHLPTVCPGAGKQTHCETREAVCARYEMPQVCALLHFEIQVIANDACKTHVR